MNILRTIFLISSALFISQNANAGERTAPTTNAPACLELRDQFDKPQKLFFPTTNVTLLTIADRKGSEQIAGWVAPVKQRFGGRIAVCGIADVSSVPGPLRGMVRKTFQKSQTHPVLMDWSGDAVKGFSYVPGKADIFVLDQGGQILQRLSGQASDRAVQELCAAIERALANEEPQPAAK